MYLYSLLSKNWKFEASLDDICNRKIGSRVQIVSCHLVEKYTEKKILLNHWLPHSVSKGFKDTTPPPHKYLFLGAAKMLWRAVGWKILNRYLWYILNIRMYGKNTIFSRYYMRNTMPLAIIYCLYLFIYFFTRHSRLEMFILPIARVQTNKNYTYYTRTKHTILRRIFCMFSKWSANV